MNELKYTIKLNHEDFMELQFALSSAMIFENDIYKTLVSYGIDEENIKYQLNKMDKINKLYQTFAYGECEVDLESEEFIYDLR